SELKALLENLQELDRSVGKVVEISWKNYEGNIQLSLSLNSRGQIVGHYRFAAGLGWEGAILSGEFHADQSYLGGWIRQLKQVQRECAGQAFRAGLASSFLCTSPTVDFSSCPERQKSMSAFMSAMRGKADSLYSLRVFRCLTRFRHADRSKILQG